MLLPLMISVCLVYFMLINYISANEIRRTSVFNQLLIFKVSFNSDKMEHETAIDMVKCDPQDSTQNDFEWLPGDLLWARMGRHPYWPCVVVVDPDNGKYFERKKIGKSFSSLLHVQFFGDNGSRSWVSTNNVMQYEGKDEFLKFTVSKKRDKRYATAFPTPKPTQKWNCSVQEAEDALLQSRLERLEFFEEYYPISINNEVINYANAGVSEKGNSLVSGGTSCVLVQSDSHMKSVKASSSPQMEKEEYTTRERKKKNYSKVAKQSKAKNKPEGVFEVFLEHCEDLVAMDNPDLQADKEKCRRFMEVMWSSMTAQEKSRYHGYFGANHISLEQ